MAFSKTSPSSSSNGAQFITAPPRYRFCGDGAKCFCFFKTAAQPRTMDSVQKEVLDIFVRTRALQEGHFVLRSGLHSGHYFQCAQVCQQLDAVERLATLLLAKLQAYKFTTVLAP